MILSAAIGCAIGCATGRVTGDPTTSVAVLLEGRTGEPARIDAWAFAGAIHGVARLEDRTVRWRVRLDGDGQLAGERWSLARRGDLGGLARLHDAQASVDKLAQGEATRCEEAERIALAQLALELTVRAWSGDDRAELPRVGAFMPAGCDP